MLGTGVTAQWTGALASMEEDPALAWPSFQGLLVSAPCYCVHACARLCPKFFFIFLMWVHCVLIREWWAVLCAFSPYVGFWLVPWAGNKLPIVAVDSLLIWKKHFFLITTCSQAFAVMPLLVMPRAVSQPQPTKTSDEIEQEATSVVCSSWFWKEFLVWLIEDMFGGWLLLIGSRAVAENGPEVNWLWQVQQMTEMTHCLCGHRYTQREDQGTFWYTLIRKVSGSRLLAVVQEEKA